MPMLCKSNNGQIYPLPQGVFGNNAGWHIMVEPEIVRGTAHSHSLMQLSVRVEGDAVLMGTTKLKPVTPLPELISNPHEPQRGSP